MIWLAWRQFRAQAMAAIGVLGAFSILLAATAPHMVSAYTASGIAACQGEGCRYLAGNFLLGLGKGYVLLYLLGLAGVVGAPALIGIFWGAPLIAGELETGTLALAWTQSTTRFRWLAVKLAMIGLAAMAVPEALAFIVGRWATPIAQASRIATGSAAPLGIGLFGLAFDARGIAPLGYAAFAVALGVTVGLLLRRTLPAMAATLALFIALQLTFPTLIRPHLLPPEQTSIVIDPSSGAISQHVTCGAGAQGIAGPQGTAGPGGCDPVAVGFTASELPGEPDAWILSSEAVDASGAPASAIPDECREESLIPSRSLASCLSSHGTRIAVTYQPAARYWPFQWIETSIYLVLAALLVAYSFWRIERRLS